MGVIRLLLALAVVITHCQFFSPHPSYTNMRMTAGQPSVELFYIISGFYMALVLNRKYNSPGANRSFYLNRILRLFPTYCVVVALTCGLGWMSLRCFAKAFPPIDFWQSHRRHMSSLSAGWLLLIQLTPLGQDSSAFFALGGDGHLHLSRHLFAGSPAWKFMVIPQAWTLGLELLFYLIAPFILRRRAIFIASLAAIMLGIRISARHYLGLDYDPWTYRFFPFELPLFLLGALGYKFFDDLPHWLTGAKFAAVLWGLSVLGILLFQKLPDHMTLAGFDWRYFVFAAFVPVIFRLTRTWNWDRFIGELSYPLYFCHMAVLFLLQAAGVAHYFMAICCGASLALALSIHLLVERPIEKLRNQIAAPAPKPRPAAGVAVNPQAVAVA